LPEQERRQIERALFEGKLWAVAATNALELGVDVGSLDATLHLGFPGTNSPYNNIRPVQGPPLAAQWNAEGILRLHQDSLCLYLKSPLTGHCQLPSILICQPELERAACSSHEGLALSITMKKGALEACHAWAETRGV